MAVNMTMFGIVRCNPLSYLVNTRKILVPFTVIVHTKAYMYMPQKVATVH